MKLKHDTPSMWTKPMKCYVRNNEIIKILHITYTNYLLIMGYLLQH